MPGAGAVDGLPPSSLPDAGAGVGLEIEVEEDVKGLVDEGVVEATGDDVAAASFFHHIHVAPWGVLGLQLDESSGKPALRGPETDAGVAILDPASLHHIQAQGPSGAAGASGAIYRAARIQGDAMFPLKVVSAIQVELQAKLHTYGEKQVIHAVGPDLREVQYDSADEEKAVEALTQAYANSLREFAASGLGRLRLLPLSGGKFSGRFAPEMPGMTVGALGAAFVQLDERQRSSVLAATSIELCIYKESEFSAYATALMRVQKALAAFLPVRVPSPTRRGSLLRGSTANSLMSASTSRMLNEGSGDIARSRKSTAQPASPTRAPGGARGASMELTRLASAEWSTKEEEPTAHNAEPPLDDEMVRYALEATIGDRPGTGQAVLRTNVEGLTGPAMREPPPDISALSNMTLVKLRAKTRRGAQEPRPTTAAKLEEVMPWNGCGSTMHSEPEPDEGSGKALLSFDAEWKAKSIQLSPDHRSASWARHPYGGLALSFEVVKKQVIGRFFEVEIDESDTSRWSDGLGIGVAMKPSKDAIMHLMDIQGRFEGYACELLPFSWLLGYDGGRAKLCGQTRYLTGGEMPRGLWRPSELRSGDVIGLLITPEGHMLLFVNEELRVMAQHCEGLDKHWMKPLVAAIDLDGCTKTVHFLATNGMPSRKVMVAHARFREAEYRVKCSDGVLKVQEVM